MTNYENELDEIRIRLYEETSDMKKDEIVRIINTRAKKIAQEFGIHITKETDENYFQTIDL
jgi:pyruvate formate-lyase activating enzyme-like uncharacterized protein